MGRFHIKRTATLALTLLALIPLSATAQFEAVDRSPDEEFFKARVVTIVESKTEESPFDSYLVDVLSGSEAGSQRVVSQQYLQDAVEVPNIRVGQTLIVHHSEHSEPAYTIHSAYRKQHILYSLLLFALVVIFFARIPGVRSLISLAAILIAIVALFVPLLAKGMNPLALSLGIGSIILVISIFGTHGVNQKTAIALLSSFSTIFLSAFLGTFFIHILQLFGTGSTSAYYLQFGNLYNVDLRGLLLAGMIIGTIGVLDDVCIVQASTVEQLAETNPNQTKEILYRKGMIVGRDHIVSMINTLVLAYTGLLLPLLLLFTYQTNFHVPLWVKLNDGEIVEEIARMIVGSMSLVVAVPITTWIAATAFSKKKEEDFHNR